MTHESYEGLLIAIRDRHAPVFQFLHEGVLLAFHASVLDMAEMRRRPAPLRPRTRRNVVNDYAVDICRQILEPFEEEGHVRWVEEHDSLTLRLDPTCAVRIKKSDVRGRTSNIPTKRQRAIATSPGQGMLFGVREDDGLAGGLAWLTVVYVPDALDEGVREVGLTFGDGRFSGLVALDRADDDSLAMLSPVAWERLQEVKRRAAQ